MRPRYEEVSSEAEALLKKAQYLANQAKDDTFNYNLELKNLDILFKKIENDN